MASVELDHVDKEYPGGTHAVSNCNLQVQDGELMVVVGPSGCGKSTVLRLLAGLETVTRGTIRIGGEVMNDLAPQQRNVAMVFQDYALYPHRSVRGNLEFPLQMRNVPRDEMRRRIERVTALLDISGLLDRLPKQLSGGQRQRVAMGRALVREPAVFLLDEPLSNLDAKLRMQVRAEIAELQRRTGTTMLYVTHDQVEAMTLGSRVAVLERGQLQQVASPRELYDRPANVFVAGFIGNPAMNLFPTSLAMDSRGRMVVAVGGQRAPISPQLLPEKIFTRLAGRRLTAGVRPEALRLASDESADGAIRAIVEHVECLGHETLAEMRVGDGQDANGAVRLIIRLPATRELRKNDPIHLELDAGQIHLFGEDGRALAF